jgi:hypothetical protein
VRALAWGAVAFIAAAACHDAALVLAGHDHHDHDGCALCYVASAPALAAAVVALVAAAFCSRVGAAKGPARLRSRRPATPANRGPPAASLTLA